MFLRGIDKFSISQRRQLAKLFLPSEKRFAIKGKEPTLVAQLDARPKKPTDLDLHCLPFSM